MCKTDDFYTEDNINRLISNINFEKFSIDDPVEIIDSDEEDEIVESLRDFLDSCKIENQTVVSTDPENFTQEDYSLNTVLCIDIGIKHLGLSGITFDQNFNFKKIIGVDLLDITGFLHPDGISEKDCHLHHTKSFTDWLEHVFWTYDNVFTNCDYIVIERQPILGLVGIEQLIFSKFREKTHLVSPNAMHNFFNINHLDYEARKDHVTKICKDLLLKQDTPVILQEFESFNRKHDIADSVCLGVFWLNSKRKEHLKYLRREKLLSSQVFCNNRYMSFRESLEIFRYSRNKFLL